MEQERAEAAGAVGDPADDRRHVRRGLARELLRRRRGVNAPLGGKLRADDRNALDPDRRHRNPDLGDLDVRQPRGLLHDRRYRDGERRDDDHEQQRGHRCRGQAAPAPQRALQPQQQRPGRDDDHRRPYQGGQERPQDPQRAADQQQDQEHAEDDSHQIAGARRQIHRKPLIKTSARRSRTGRRAIIARTDVHRGTWKATPAGQLEIGPSSRMFARPIGCMLGYM